MSATTTEPEVWVELAHAEERTATTRGSVPLTSAAGAKVLTKLSDDMLAGVSETLRKICQMVARSFPADSIPNEFAVKFGLKIGAKGGTNIFVLTEATGEATLAIEAKWTKPKMANGGVE